MANRSFPCVHSSKTVRIWNTLVLSGRLLSPQKSVADDSHTSKHESSATKPLQL